MGNYSTAYYSAVALANEEADTLAELAIEKEEAIMNPSYLLDGLDYKPTNYSRYSFELAMHTVMDCIEKYLVVLANLRNKTDDPSVQSLLDDMMRYWNKEKDYKIKARLADSDWE